MALWAAAAAVAAGWFLVGVLRGRRSWIKVVPALLLGVAVAPVSPTGLAAFIGCAAGDGLLLDKDRYFLHGLAAFLVAHLLLVASFVPRAEGPPSLAVGLGVAGLVLGMSAVLVPKVRGVLRLAIPAYAATIGAMILAAAAVGPLALGGAVTFAVSDSVLAINRFVRPFAAADAVVMSTYYAAILTLAAALLR